MRIGHSLLVLLVGLPLFAAEARIGLMLQGPGSKLYSRFGHIGLVLEDNNPQLAQQLADAGYNWGGAVSRVLFDFGNMNFGDRDFVPNIIRGRMYYSSLAKPFPPIERYNRLREHRQMRILWLNFTPEEVQTVKQRLLTMVDRKSNIYIYDYYFRNCSTYPRDVIDHVFNGALERETTGLPAPTFRALVHQALYPHFWSDMLLFFLQGAMLDRPRDLWQAMFMPHYLGEGLLHSQRDNGQPMVSQVEWLYRETSPQLLPVRSNNLAALAVGLGCSLLLVLFLLWARRSTRHPLQRELSTFAQRSLALLVFLLLLVPTFLAVIIAIAATYYPMQVPQNNLNLLLASPLLLLSMVASARLLSRQPAPWAWAVLRWVARAHLAAALVNALLWLLPPVRQHNSQIWLLLTPLHATMLFLYPTVGGGLRNLRKKGI